MREKAMLEQFFINKGVPKDRAEIMAKQLLKRAKQIAQEREIDEADALQYLLEVMVSGNKGEVDPRASGKKGLDPDRK